ncbi:MAG: hypothetical protein AB8G96_03615 [Phycisphaerales bacterium]
MLHRGARAAFATDATPATGRRRFARTSGLIRGISLATLTVVAGLVAVGPMADSADAAAVAVQSRPDSLNRLATRPSLGGPELERIEAYADYWGTRLAGGGDQAPEAAQRLLEPLTTTTPSRSFRDAYAAVIVPQMRQIARDPKTAHTAVNSMIITSQLGTASALSLLERMADPGRQDRWNVRMAASRGVGFILANDRSNLVPTQNRVDAARAMAENLKEETDPRVVRRALTSIILADSNRVAEPNRIAIHSLFASAIADIADRATGDLGLAVAASDAVVEARRAYFTLNSAPTLQVSFCRAVSVPLTDLLDAYGENWTGAGSSRTTPRTLLPHLQRTETTLGILVARLNPNRAIEAELPASTAWNDRARPDFDAALSTWRSAING